VPGVVIRTERLVLRPFEGRDLHAFLEYRRDPEIAAFQSWDAEYSMADAERFLAEQQGRDLAGRGEWVQLAITDGRDGSLLGDCATHVLADQPSTTEIGITLARASQRRGVAREALRGLLRALFADHGMHRVIAHADDRNVPVHRLLEGLGMRCEGRFVEADWFKGEWTTLRLYAMLAREYPGSGADRFH
jgi:RimJ/RimL family protein N-acetyltransferase